MFKAQQSPIRGHQGAAILFVLGFVMAGSWFSLSIIERVRSQLAESNARPEGVDLRFAAFQGLELTLAVLSEFKLVDEGLYSPSQGWGKPQQWAQRISENPAAEQAENNASTSAYSLAEYARYELPSGIHYDIRFEDESGRWPLHSTSEERFDLVFEQLGLNASDARTLRDSLLDWIDADDEAREFGAELTYYSALEPPMDTRNRPLEDLSELRYVRGFSDHFFHASGTPNELYHRFSRIFTVRNVGDRTNWNTASMDLLQVLEEERGVQISRMEEFLAGKDFIRGTWDDGVYRKKMHRRHLPRDDEGKRLKTPNPIRYLGIQVSASNGFGSHQVYARVDLEQGSEGLPWSVLELRENLDAIVELDLHQERAEADRQLFELLD